MERAFSLAVLVFAGFAASSCSPDAAHETVSKPDASHSATGDSVGSAAGPAGASDLSAGPQQGGSGITAKLPKAAASRSDQCPVNKIAFQCVTGGKVATLCVQPDGVARYSFGASNKPEMVFPGNAGDGVIRFASQGLSGGDGELQFSFARAGYTYALYDSSKPEGWEEENDGKKFRSGIAIWRGRTLISDKGCDGSGSAMRYVEGRDEMPVGMFRER